MSTSEEPLPGLMDSLYGSFGMVYDALYPYFHSEPDPRAENWLLMSSVYPTLAMFTLYLLIVWLGPKYMAHREAFSLKYVLIVYNFMLVLLSGYMLYEFIANSFGNPEFNLWCSQVDRSDNVHAVRLAKATWWYYLSKPIEFFDTFFFILRKKDSQISFLHVYHHSTMPLLWWAGARFVPGGCAFLAPMLNSGVHVLMYSYYLLSAMGPTFRKYLWWKKYMTAIQLLQFWLILVHTIYASYTNCGFPIGYGVAQILYMVSHILLFTNFYNKAYRASADTVKALSPRSKPSQKSNGTKVKQQKAD